MTSNQPTLPSTSSVATPPATFFFDTNALVQGYLPNTPGTAWVRQILGKRQGAIPVYISALARVEFRSSLYKLERVFGTHSSFTDALVNRFDRDVRLSLDGAKQRLYTVVALSEDVIERARVLLRTYRSGRPQAPRSLDALQLTMVTSDRQLGGVVLHEGLAVIRPEDANKRS